MKESRKNHHVWCNYYDGDPTTCKMCDKLDERAPELEEE
jgi:hypothetical protein